MAGIAKCMGIITGAGFLTGAGASYCMQRKANNVILEGAKSRAQDGKIKIGGQKPDGTLWDGEMTIDDLKKDLNKKSLISSAIIGAVTTVGTAIVAGLTLLLRGKVKVK